MANHAGSEGTVKIGANTIAEVTKWAFSETGDQKEDTEIGDTARTYKAGRTDATGSIECHWDETDTNGQEAMTINAEVTLNLYPEGADSGDKYWTGSVFITNIDMEGDGENIIPRSFQWKANGGMTLSTVA